MEGTKQDALWSES